MFVEFKKKFLCLLIIFEYVVMFFWYNFFFG